MYLLFVLAFTLAKLSIQKIKKYLQKEEREGILDDAPQRNKPSQMN